jgi:sugar phosphate isomerase/epimerase
LLNGLAAVGAPALEPFLGSAEDARLAWSEQETRQFAARAAAMGIGIPSVAIGIFNGDPAPVEPAGKERAIEITRRCIAFTAAAGGNVMLLCTFLQSHPDTPEKKACVLEVVRAVEPLARERGVVIALETPLPAEELAALADAAESDHVGVYYDVGNAVFLGFDPAREIEALGARIRGMHIKDTHGSLAGLHLGEGDLDLKASMDTLQRIGYDGWLMLETPGDDPDAVREDMRKVQRLIG